MDLHEEINQTISNESDRDDTDDFYSIVEKISAPFPCDIKRENKCDHDTDEQIYSDCIVCTIVDLRIKSKLIARHMGSMAQCRGANGDLLRDAGSISAVLDILWKLIFPMDIVITASNEDNFFTTSEGKVVHLPILPPIGRESALDSSTFSFRCCRKHNRLLRIHRMLFTRYALYELDSAALDLAIACLGTLRDLSCGSASSRAAILEWVPLVGGTAASRCSTSTRRIIKNGIHLIGSYVERYDKWSWEEILSLHERGILLKSHHSISDPPLSENPTQQSMVRGKKEMRLLTNALGAIRNTSHSTPDNCDEFFNYGIVDLLVRRLMPEIKNSHLATEKINSHIEAVVPPSFIPDATQPWREACYRAAGSLINLAEKCPSVAYQIASNRRLIYLLIVAWGGTKAVTSESKALKNTTTSIKGVPLLHIGLAAILHSAEDGALEGGLDDVMLQVLEKEKIRKKIAQRNEEERKRRLWEKK
mmetsp:Transcript_26533/g.54439  ORF Transcript_26533/g.54439 Transcript_26533/m.54439 type:complete len:477 (+) Transcript_26533:162-1592(+)|eukprot:CAMPEP_0171412744 /NCGR_PEP_ID=MMETSP0880-20121228/33286_1 /TAXON_ID=67004 /ORGANISM="Thalassiosira weissflogii, Strain CCMP1336" /LENGTH=476 /DNA_ID=CAMNT_0011930211 /DNA_START=144 /DNA_END=1574 /DNA_ORIENTATION=+